MYLNGESVEIDEARALEWFIYAAEKGIVEALFTLGIMYEQGLGTTPDEKQAYVYYEQAAIGGYDDAQYRLGSIYLEGLLGKNKIMKGRWSGLNAQQHNFI